MLEKSRKASLKKALSRRSFLGGSQVVLSGIKSRVTIVISYIWGGLTTPLIPTHDPPSWL